MVVYFWRGLSDRITIRCEKRPSNLDDAVIEARKVEQRIGPEKEEKKEDRILLTREAPVPEKTAQDKPTCQFCEKKGHSAKDCWKIVGGPNRGPTNQRQFSGPPSRAGSVRMGHQRFYNQRGPKRCYSCGQTGHLRYDCPLEQQRPASQQQNRPTQGQEHTERPNNQPPIINRQDQMAYTQRDLQQFLEQQQQQQQQGTAWNEQKNEKRGPA